jgi:ADP-ribose pyrophosphatase
MQSSRQIQGVRCFDRGLYLRANGFERKSCMKVEIHRRRRVFDGFFKIDEAELQYERFDGQMSPVVKRLNFSRGDSVAAVVVNIDDRKVILVNQFKFPAYENGSGWITEVVAGMVEPGESPETAVRREILEETGYETRRLEHISTFFVSPGGTSERIILFYAEVENAGRHGSGGGLVSEGEDIRLIELTPAEVREMLASKAFEDAKTILGLNWLEGRLQEGI